MRAPRIILTSLAALLLGLGALVWRGCSGSDKDDSTLRVGMDLTYAPFEYINDKGEHAGLGVMLAENLAKGLKRKLEIVPMEFPALIRGLESGRIDVVVSSMTITDERKKQVDFSNPYLRTGLAVLTRTASGVERVEDLNDPGRKVIVRPGTTGEEYVKKHLPKANRLEVTEDVECVLALTQGLGDAYFYDQIAIWRYQLQHRDTTKAFPVPEHMEHYGVGVAKGNRALLDGVNRVLDEILKDGSLKAASQGFLAKENEMVKTWKLPSFFPEDGTASF